MKLVKHETIYRTAAIFDLIDNLICKLRVNVVLIVATLISVLVSLFPFTNQTIATKCIDQPAAAADSSRAGS